MYIYIYIYIVLSGISEMQQFLTAREFIQNCVNVLGVLLIMAYMGRLCPK